MNNLDNQAIEVLKLAGEVAQEYGLGYVGTEHLLLAILREGSSLATEILCEQGANEYATQNVVDELVENRSQETWVAGRQPGAPHFRDVLSKANEEARGSGNWQVTPEHLLLGLLAEEQSLGCRALKQLGVSTEQVRKAMSAQRTKQA